MRAIKIDFCNLNLLKTKTFQHENVRVCFVSLLKGLSLTNFNLGSKSIT